MKNASWMVRVVAAALALLVVAPGAAAQGRLEKSWEALQRVGKADRAYAMAVKQAEAEPESWDWALRAAKSAGTLGDGEGAGKWLRACAERGYTGISTIEAATEFESVKTDAAYLEGLEAVRTAATARFEKFKSEAEAAVPRVIEPDDGVNPGDNDFTLVLALHGTGGHGGVMAESVAATLKGAGKRALVVGPDAIRPSGDGYAWTYLDEASWYIEYLVKRYSDDYELTPDRVVLVGFSQGANVILHLLKTKPGLMGGAIVVGGYFEDGMFDGVTAGAEAPRVSLIVGQRDPAVRTNREGVKALETAGFAVELRELRGRGHEFPEGATGVTEIGGAMGFVLGEGP